MKEYKTIEGFIKHLTEIADHPVVDLKGSERYSEEQISSLIAIKATIDNELGEFFCKHHITHKGVIKKRAKSKFECLLTKKAIQKKLGV